MNSQIYEICENFNFSSLKLENPTLLNANIYFSKLNSNLNKNFYIQLPKCKTKQGIIQANNKCFCDLEFNSSDKLIVEFFEKQKLEPIHMPGCLLSGHASFTWGKTSNKAFENAIALEACANMAYHSIIINSDINFPDYVLKKHFTRKHGINAYYGQI